MTQNPGNPNIKPEEMEIIEQELPDELMKAGLEDEDEQEDEIIVEAQPKRDEYKELPKKAEGLTEIGLPPMIDYGMDPE